MSTDGQVLSSTNTAFFFEYDAWLFSCRSVRCLTMEVSFGTTGNDESKGVLPLDFDNFIAVGSCRGALDNPYTPYAGGVYDMFLQGSFLPFQPPRSMLATNIQDGPTLSSIAIHPNPTSSMVRITMPPETTTNTVTIYNISGQVLFSEQTSEVIYTTDLTQFSQGTYVVEVKNSTGVFRDRVQKIVIHYCITKADE